MLRLLGALPGWAAWAATAALVVAAAGLGYSSGVSRESDRRDAIALAQANEAMAQYLAAVERGRAAVFDLQARLDSQTGRQRHVRDEIRRTPVEQLGYCGEAAPARVVSALPAAPALAVASAEAAPAVAVHGAGQCVVAAPFVRLWNDALGVAAEPAANSGRAAAPAGQAGATAAAGLSLAAVLENHAENAASCSNDRARHQALIDFLQAGK